MEKQNQTSLRGRIKNTLVELEFQRNACVFEASILATGFRNERISLHKEWLASVTARHRSRGAHSKGTWCPLNLFARLQNGSLQIYWQLVNRDRNTGNLRYDHLPKTGADGYDLRTLLRHAHSFEQQLVKEYEEDARIQRSRWKELIAAKHHLEMALRRHDTKSALILRKQAESMARKAATTPTEENS